MSHLLSITDPYYDLGKGTAGSESEGFSTQSSITGGEHHCFVAASQDRLFSSLCVRALPHLDQVNHPPPPANTHPTLAGKKIKRCLALSQQQQAAEIKEQQL